MIGLFCITNGVVASFPSIVTLPSAVIVNSIFSVDLIYPLGAIVSSKV